MVDITDLEKQTTEEADQNNNLGPSKDSNGLNKKTLEGEEEANKKSKKGKRRRRRDESREEFFTAEDSARRLAK